MIDILDFIDALRHTDGYIETIYTHGGCYKLHILLKRIYIECIPLINKDKNHVVTLYKGKIYDINGLVTQNEEYFAMSEQDYEIAEQWSFSRNVWLTLGDCPACGEQLIVNVKGEIEC